MKNKYIIILFICVNITFAQPIGSNQTFTANSTFQPNIKDVNIVLPAPELRDSIKRLDVSSYDFNLKPLFSKFDTKSIDAAKMQSEPIQQLHYAYLKIGCGNYLTPLVHLTANSLRTKDFMWSADYKHLSSSSSINENGYGIKNQNKLNLETKNLLNKYAIYSKLNIQRHSFYYNNFNTSNVKETNEELFQNYTIFAPSIQLKSYYTDSSKINHTINFQFYNWNDRFKSNEKNINLNALFYTYLFKQSIDIRGHVEYYNHLQGNINFNNTIIKLNPYINFQASKLKARGGITLCSDIVTGAISNTSFYMLPNVQSTYELTPNLTYLYAEYNTALNKNSYNSITNTNLFMDTLYSLKNSITKGSFMLGLKGNLNYHFMYDVATSYQVIDNMPFFILKNNSTTSNQIYKYDVLYDAANVFNIKAQAHYQASSRFAISTIANYYQYQLNTLKEACNKPALEWDLIAKYNIQQKIIFIASCKYFGVRPNGEKINKQDSKSIQYIDSYIDVNVGIEFRYSKLFSAFINCNNLTNQDYFIWDKYQSQRFNFIFGITLIPF